MVFAGIMMILVGAFQAIDGLIALFKDDLYVVRPSGLVINIDYTAWGWVHLLLGVLLSRRGLRGLLARSGVARGLSPRCSAHRESTFIPAYPLIASPRASCADRARRRARDNAEPATGPARLVIWIHLARLQDEITAELEHVAAQVRTSVIDADEDRRENRLAIDELHDGRPPTGIRPHEG